MSYLYQGNRVYIPPAAEVFGVFKPDNHIFSDEVQAALDEIEPWKRGEDPYHTFELSREIGARVVALNQSQLSRLRWGTNPFHQARNPGLSPYVELSLGDERQITNLATLELASTPDRPILTRVYPGEYMPPLPWMKSANQAPGGKQQCLEFWHLQAFIYRNVPVRESLVEEAPDWYQPAAYPLAQTAPES